MIEFLITNWAYVTIGILVIDKVVALTPCKHDDMIWTSIKSILSKVLPGKKI